ncbi:ankyrin repeat protein [Legionella birminghamensis]|uniref:Ankyrin repeat protein n=1 Tax=Legionella birminghamensis TaxID=28083 RepID=A0A378I7W4_9GAMM|nr:hypothetical protein [Legionella birminghamensis]KTC68157.1 ankyrin repeat protein [Legionella birminghamensis]STX31133.1 ankyrin repeat protein [Legionella birminghamensis]
MIDLNQLFNDLLNKYPELKAYLDSEPPNTRLISRDLSKSYKLNDEAFTLVDVCVIGGKEKHLEALKPGPRDMKETSYSAIRWVAQTGNMAILEQLENALIAETKNYTKPALQERMFMPFILAAENDHMEMIKRFERWLEKEMNVALRANEYFVIRRLAYAVKIDFIRHFETHLTDAQKKELVRVRDYDILRNAVHKSNLEIFKHFEAYASIADMKDFCFGRTVYHSMIVEAALNGKSNPALLYHLLAFLAVMIDKENDVLQFDGERYSPFVIQQLTLIHERRAALKAKHPDETFELSDKEAKTAFYTLRALIRYGIKSENAGAEDSLNYVHVLLGLLRNIPVVKEEERILMQAQSELLSLVKRVCDSINPLPEAIKGVKTILDEKGSDPEACVMAIREYCQKENGQLSRMSPQMFSPSQKEIKQFCTILAFINDEKIMASVDALRELIEKRMSNAASVESSTPEILTPGLSGI